MAIEFVAFGKDTCRDSAARDCVRNRNKEVWGKEPPDG